MESQNNNTNEDQLFNIYEIEMSNGIKIHGYFPEPIDGKFELLSGMINHRLKTRNKDMRYCEMYCNMMNNISNKALVMNISEYGYKIVDLKDTLIRDNDELVFMSNFMDRDREIQIIKSILLKEDKYKELYNRYAMSA